MSIGHLSSFIRRLRGDMAASQRGGLSDAQLLDRWLVQRDEAAFEVLLWRHGPMILSVCRRVLHNDADVEDTFQAAFLLLVRKAAAIRRGESVAAWLYQTAYRVALRARQRSRQRSAREATGVELLTAEASDDVLWRDVRPILDDEINRLPEKYRIPFIRCYLEGCTNEEAAVEMGCPVGTIHSRLAWARERLRSRLTRRGVTLATASLTALLAHSVASAIPPTLAEKTLQAAFAYAAHSVAATGVSAGAVALTKGVLRTMLLAKLKWGAVAVLAVTLCGGVGGLTYYHVAEAAGGPPSGVLIPFVALRPVPAPASVAPAPRTIKVPSGTNGTLLFLATEMKPDEVVPANKKIVEKYWMLAILLNEKEAPPTEPVIVENAKKGAVYRKWQPKDGFPPMRLSVGYLTKTFRKLAEGDVVKKGQLLALIDTDIAHDELENKIAKIDASQAELQTSTETKKEAEQRYNRIRNANIRNPGTFAPEEESGALLTWRKYVEEEQAKAANLVRAQKEANAAITILKKHEIRAPVSGEIKVIRIQPGEAVKSLETVLEILPLDEDK